VCSAFVRLIQSRLCNVGGMINGTLRDLLKTTAIDSSGLNMETKLGNSKKFFSHNFIKIVQRCIGRNDKYLLFCNLFYSYNA